LRCRNGGGKNISWGREVLEAAVTRINRIAFGALALATAGALGLLAGCADQPKDTPRAATFTLATPPAAPAAPVAVAPMPVATQVASAAPMVHDEKSLVFFDSDVFDLSFADALRTGSDRIDVNFAGPTSLNSFPARMNVWLSEVKRSDGEVTAVDPNHPTQTRGLFGVGIIFDLIDAISTMQERRAQSARLALAHDYNAKIIYDAVSGTAREVMFTRRAAEPAVGTPPATSPAPITGPAPTTTGS
jgi:hypothetical protein